MQIRDRNSSQEARQLLKKHFGDPYKIASAYLSRISNWPSVKPNDGTGLQELSIVLEQARNAMSSMAYMNDLNTANVLRQLWEKLPRHLRSKWTERVSKIRNASEQMASFMIFASSCLNKLIWLQIQSILKKQLRDQRKRCKILQTRRSKIQERQRFKLWNNYVKTRWKHEKPSFP